MPRSAIHEALQIIDMTRGAQLEVQRKHRCLLVFLISEA